MTRNGYRQGVGVTYAGMFKFIHPYTCMPVQRGTFRLVQYIYNTLFDTVPISVYAWI